MLEENSTNINNKEVYIIETEFSNDKTIKELIKELILNSHIETSPEKWYN